MVELAPLESGDRSSAMAVGAVRDTPVARGEREDAVAPEPTFGGYPLHLNTSTGRTTITMAATTAAKGLGRTAAEQGIGIPD